MRKRFFENKVVLILMIIIGAVMLTPIVSDCVCFFWEESLQWDVIQVAENVAITDSETVEDIVTEITDAEMDESAEEDSRTSGYIHENTLDQLALEQDLRKNQTNRKNQEDQKVDEADENAENTENVENEEQNAGEDTQDYYLKINRAANCVTVYAKDKNGEYTVPYKSIVCSTGKYNRTPMGIYTLSTRYRWRKMVGGVYSQYATRVHGSILIHSVPYYRQNNGTLETNQYNKLGEQASLGCIRMCVEDAKWIFDHCEEGTKVEIYEDKDTPGPLGKPDAIKIDTGSPNKGWDPTDPAEENPWMESGEQATPETEAAGKK